MGRIGWIEHKGRPILFEDMSGLRDSADICAVSNASTALTQQLNQPTCGGGDTR
jgi:hypothetical protein